MYRPVDIIPKVLITLNLLNCLACKYIQKALAASYPQNRVLLIAEVINILILCVLSVSPVPDTQLPLIEAHPFK